MITIIAAVSLNGVIGLGNSNSLPWQGKYPEDMKFFRETTKDSVVIMGRKTFESMNSKPLPKRKNIVVSRNANPLVAIDSNIFEFAVSLSEAIDKAKIENKEIFIIGGSSIYEEGLKFADRILLTVIPEEISGDNLIKFPWINPLKFKMEHYKTLAEGLEVIKYEV